MIEEPDVKLSGTEEATLAQYQAISPLAVVALLLGALSAVALAHPVLWVLPAMAAFTALVALRGIANRSGAMVGRKAAIVGLALALFFGACAPARLLARQWILYRHAHSFAQDWFQLLQSSDLQTAHQLTLSPGERQLPGVSLDDYYGDDVEVQDSLDAFFEREPAQAVVQLGAQAQLKFVRNVEQKGEARATYVVQDFQVVHRDKQGAGVSVRLVLKRTVSRQGDRVGWQVVDLANPEKEDAAP